jgi:5-formyltetrahydrofolate cyclo-ligase
MQMVPEIPTDVHDVEMHYICHERGILTVEGRDA